MACVAASDSSRALENRCAGSFAIAFAMTQSIWVGSHGATSVTLGGG